MPAFCRSALACLWLLPWCISAFSHRVSNRFTPSQRLLILQRPIGSALVCNRKIVNSSLLKRLPDLIKRIWTRCSRVWTYLSVSKQYNLSPAQALKLTEVLYTTRCMVPYPGPWNSSSAAGSTAEKKERSYSLTFHHMHGSFSFYYIDLTSNVDRRVMMLLERPCPSFRPRERERPKKRCICMNPWLRHA